MKKLIYVSLACILLAAGCSNTEDEEVTNDPSVNEDQEEQENNDDGQNADDKSDQETNNEDTEKEDEDEEEKESDEGDKEGSDEEEDNPTLTKEQAEEVAIEAETSFKDIINSAEEESSIMKGYETKEDIVNELQNVISQNLAKSLTDSFFVMRDDNLYLEAKGGPLWFEQGQSFTLKQQSEQEYIIVQEQNSEMTGNVVMHYTLTYNGEKWVLGHLESKQKAQSESKVTEEQAVELVHEQIGAQAENVKVEVDHTEGNHYVVQVYEVVEEDNNTHTATKGWYYVDQDTGEVTNRMN